MDDKIYIVKSYFNRTQPKEKRSEMDQENSGFQFTKLTDSMEVNLTWEAASQSVSQEFCNILQNPIIR
jgi:hypothetical protein